MKRTVLALAALLVVGTVPATAQEWDVARRQYTFIDNRLDIDVVVESAGTLRLIRGMPGSVEVAGRARNGFTGFALGDHNVPELRLSAVGADRVEYLVVVPENVRVRVKIPGRSVAEVFGSTRNAASYEWLALPADDVGDRDLRRRAPTSAPAAPTPAPGAPAPATPTDPQNQPLASRFGPPPAPSATPGMFTTYAGDAPPDVVTFPRAEVIGTLTVRVEGDHFRIAASRPLGLQRGDPRLVEIRPVGEPMDLVIVVPTWTTDFVVEVAGSPAFAVTEGRPMALCTPVTQQLLEGGRLWYTFSPVDGQLDCSGAAVRRGTRGS